MEKGNIILIGMPGAGKSTIGVLLAKAMKMPFVDTDLLIRKRESCYLQEILNTRGIEEFKRIEESVILQLDVRDHIIATGGSVIYSEAAIQHLKSTGILVFLDTKLYQLERRLKNAGSRGIAMESGQTLSALYHERLPLYRKYADVEINCSRKHVEMIIAEIRSLIDSK